MAQRAFISRTPFVVPPPPKPKSKQPNTAEETRASATHVSSPQPITIKKQLSTIEIAHMTKGTWGCTNPQQHWGFHYWRNQVPLEDGEPVNQRVCNVCHWDTAGLGYVGRGNLWQFPPALQEALRVALTNRYGPDNW